MTRVRDHRIADDEAGHGRVASLEEGTRPDTVRIWVAPAGSVAAPFDPWWLGVREVPLSDGRHRSLTGGASSSFFEPDCQVQRATEFAGRTFKQVPYSMCGKPETSMPVVSEFLEGFEAESFEDLPRVENAAREPIAADGRDRARMLLAHYAAGRAEEALRMGETLVEALGTHLALTEGLRRPGEAASINDEGGEAVNCLAGADPDRPKDAQ